MGSEKNAVSPRLLEGFLLIVRAIGSPSSPRFAESWLVLLVHVLEVVRERK
jgi:hypothetical protein